MRTVLVYLATVAIGARASASFTVVKGINNWNAAVPSSTTIDFVFAQPQILSTQYLTLGVLFPESEEVAEPISSALQDGWGCKGQIGGDADIHLRFTQPQYAIGAWFPGKLFAKLYWQGSLIYSSPGLDTFQITYGFGGVISTQAFDEVVLWDNDGFVFVDDIKFSSTVPNPGAAGLFLLAAVTRNTRRRVP